jgi:putative flippase GtrA
VIEPPATTPPPGTAQRFGNALGRRSNWEQLAKFCVVGASGYVVYLGVYSFLINQANLHYLSATAPAFLVAVANNYTWNRMWTFREQQGRIANQGFRFLIVSLVAFGCNELLLYTLVHAGLGKIVAAAIAVMVVTPVNFLGNKFWSFRR